MIWKFMKTLISVHQLEIGVPSLSGGNWRNAIIKLRILKLYESINIGASGKDWCTQRMRWKLE